MKFEIGQLIRHKYGPSTIGFIIGIVPAKKRKDTHYRIRWFRYESFSDLTEEFIEFCE